MTPAISILRVRNKDGSVTEIPALRGMSAYEIAVKYGFEGSEEDYANFLSVTQLAANALTKEVAGSAAALKNVSPLRHLIDVKLSTGGATITKYGKNMIDPQAYLGASYQTTLNGDVFTSQMTSGTLFLNYHKKHVLRAGTYTVTLIPEQTMTCMLYFYSAADKNVMALTPKYLINVSDKVVYTFTAPEDFIFSIGGYVDHYGTYSYRVQLESGTGTEYVAGIPWEQYTADAEGNVNGIYGVGEDMTLVPDADGVTIRAVYNRDVAKEIAALEKRVSALETAFLNQ